MRMQKQGCILLKPNPGKDIFSNFQMPRNKIDLSFYLNEIILRVMKL